MSKKSNLLQDTFEVLDFEYKENIHKNEYVDALNSLDDVDRNLIISYIVNGGHYSQLSREMGLSVPFIREKIEEIRIKIKEQINENTEENY